MSVFIGYPSFMAYQMMKGKKDNNDGFPSIPGTIARYSALGLTNEEMSKNPVWVDKTGNGHDLQMKNFAWGGMSGVNGYVQNFNYFRNNATVDKVRIDEQSSNSIKVTLLTSGMGHVIYIPKNIYQSNKSYFIKISSEGYNEEGEYAGYLVTDGVDDSGRAVGLTISKDFTLVGEWILFSKTSVNAGLSIHPQIHIFNRPEAIQITFRTAGKTLPVKSLKVICSDGRCYDENWNEFKINVGEFISSNGVLYVASNGTYYAQIAFKNLGIYNDQIFSKDDCIKAYNYLQTLKAKYH